MVLTSIEKSINPVLCVRCNAILFKGLNLDVAVIGKCYFDSMFKGVTGYL